MKHTTWIRGGLLAMSAILFTACAKDGGDSLAQLLDVSAPPPVPAKPAEPLPVGLLASAMSQGVPEIPMTVAIERYEHFRPQIKNDKWISLIDFTQPSGSPRLYVIDTQTGKVDFIHVAHGVNSDPGDTGTPTRFSNVPNSRKSSLGAYLIQEKYYGKHGASMRTDGLEPTNDMVRRRAIVVHSANYVSDSKAKQGMSWGCPAVPQAWMEKLIERLRDGSFMYAYSTVASNIQLDQFEIQRMMIDPAFRWIDEAEEAPFDGE